MNKAFAFIKQYGWNILHVLDQMANVLLFGDPRWTLSGRMGRNIASGRCALCRPICWALGMLDTDHCTKAFKADAAADPDAGQLVEE